MHGSPAKALIRLAPPELVLSEITIKDLPLYSADHDADYPPVARALKHAIADVDVALFEVEAYILFKAGFITADGEVSDEAMAAFLRNYMAELHAFTVRVLAKPRTA